MQKETLGNWSFTGCGTNSSCFGGGAGPAMSLLFSLRSFLQNPLQERYKRLKPHSPTHIHTTAKRSNLSQKISRQTSRSKGFKRQDPILHQPKGEDSSRSPTRRFYKKKRREGRSSRRRDSPPAVEQKTGKGVMKRSPDG
ncbi:hypothetical protein BHM03_00037670 [Ensete ventricosum]|nr:hypothetical protein BHM03_00037670 [Ensete ventricosum]